MIRLRTAVLGVALGTAFAGGTAWPAPDGGYAWESIWSSPPQVDALGAGMANNAISGSGSCAGLNPALLHGLLGKELGMVYGLLTAGTEATQMSAALPFVVGNSVHPVGLQVFRLQTGSAERTTVFGEPLGYTFSEQFIAVSVAGSHYFSDWDLSAGLGIRNVFQTIDDYSASGMSADLGVLFPATGRTSWGISLVNALPTKFAGVQVPAVARSGVRHRAGRFWMGDVRVFGEMDLIGVYNADKLAVRWALGADYAVFYFPVSVSAYIGSNYVSVGVSAGRENITVGYSATASPAGVESRIGLLYRFDLLPEEVRREYRRELSDIKAEKARVIGEMREQQRQLEQVKKDFKVERAVTSLMISAREQFNKKKYLEAQKTLHKALSLDKKNEDVLSLLSVVSMYLDEGTASRLYAEARASYDQGKYDESLRKLDRLLEVSPNDQKAQVLKYTVTAQQKILAKQYQDAKKDLYFVLPLDPSNEVILELLRKIDTLTGLEQ